jgi:DhnA family fructose-bisphosphate aldolase class Ia
VGLDGPDQGGPAVADWLRRLVDTRARRPEAIGELARARRTRPLLDSSGQLLIVAADHGARAALGSGPAPMAMASRVELVDRLLAALSRPGVDGVLGTPDVLEDLLLLGALDGKVVLGSMNRGGLVGAEFELDDRFTGYDAEALAGMRFDGGKMLLRIDLTDPGSAATLEACAHAVTGLARHRLMAVVEPFWSRRLDGRVSHDLSPDAVIRAIAVASGLGVTSAYTWLKVPVVDEMERVMAASTLPALLLGGDAAADRDATYTRWRQALALPTVRGLVVGRNLLYPPDGDVAAAVDSAAALLGRTAPAEVRA